MKLPSAIEECYALINPLLGTIALLQNKVSGFDRQLNPNSRNSHRPPSSDGLKKKRKAILAFARHRCVPFTNNLAERDIRPDKTKLRVAGCFHTLKGAQVYARINRLATT